MKKKLIFLFAIIACGIVMVVLFSGHSDIPATSDVNNKASSPRTSSSEGAKSTNSNQQVIAEAAASIARPAPPEPADIERVLNRKLAQSGEKLDIKVKRSNGRELIPILNEAGETERVQMEPLEMLTVSLHYAEGKPGQKVLVAPYDGGKVNGKAATAHQIPLDENGSLNFEFTADGNLGRYQVSLDKGGDAKNLRVWVGPRPKLTGE